MLKLPVDCRRLPPPHAVFSLSAGRPPKQWRAFDRAPPPCEMVCAHFVSATFSQTITLRAGAQGRRLNCRWVCRHSAGRPLEPPTRLPRSRQQQVMLPPCRNCLPSVKVPKVGLTPSPYAFLFNFRPSNFGPSDLPKCPEQRRCSQNPNLARGPEDAVALPEPAEL